MPGLIGSGYVAGGDRAPFEPDLDAFGWMEKNRAILPPLRFDCGREDSLLERNRELLAELLAANIPHEYHEFAGGNTSRTPCRFLNVYARRTRASKHFNTTDDATHAPAGGSTPIQKRLSSARPPTWLGSILSSIPWPRGRDHGYSNDATPWLGTPHSFRHIPHPSSQPTTHHAPPRSITPGNSPTAGWPATTGRWKPPAPIQPHRVKPPWARARYPPATSSRQ